MKPFTMKTRKLMAVFFFSAVLAGASPALAADVTTAVDLNSAYVWRGITFNDGLVAQPSVDVAAGNFGFNVWGNIDLDDYDESLDKGELSEVDLTLTYGFDAGPIGITAGYIEYLFPCAASGGGEATSEIFLDASLEPADGISIGITGYYDIDEVVDYYLNAYVGYGISFDSGLDVDFSAAVGYAGEDFAIAYGGMESGFYDYTVSIGLGYAINEMISVSASLNYTDAFDDDVLPEQDTDVFGGAGIALAF